MAEYTLRFVSSRRLRGRGCVYTQKPVTHATGCVHAPDAKTHLALAYTHPLRIRTLILVRYTAARVYYSTHPDRACLLSLFFIQHPIMFNMELEI